MKIFAALLIALPCFAAQELTTPAGTNVFLVKTVWDSQEIKRVVGHAFTDTMHWPVADSVTYEQDGVTPADTLQLSAWRKDEYRAGRSPHWLERRPEGTHVVVFFRYETDWDRRGFRDGGDNGSNVRHGLRQVLLLHAPQFDQETLIRQVAHCDMSGSTIRLNGLGINDEAGCTTWLREEDYDVDILILAAFDGLQ